MDDQFMKPDCPKCKIPMEIGQALQGQETDPNVKAEYEFYSNQDLRLDSCWKCPQCGHSETY